MRIAIICTYYPYPPSVGGVETLVRYVATELAKRGHEVHIISSTCDVTSQRPVTTSGVEERDEVIIHKLESFSIGIGYARVLKGLWRVVEGIKPDIVHVHNLHPSLFQLAMRKRSIGYVLVAELHHPAVNLDFTVQRMTMPMATLMLRKMSGYIDAFIAHTDLEVKWLRSVGISARIAKIFMPAMAVREYSAKVLNTVKDSRLIVCISRLVPKKGIHVLLKAFSRLYKDHKDLRLYIAGRSDSKYIKLLHELIMRLELKGSVTIKGFIDETEKLEMMAKARVFTLPTLADYHPIVLLEAQAVGTPVVTTRVGAIPEIVTHGETGLLVEPGNVDELEKALNILLTNEKLWKNMSLKAKKQADRFAPSKVVNELEELYNNLL